ncbi:MAG: TolB family protein, partial [Phototrophicaceae bacterium]
GTLLLLLAASLGWLLRQLFRFIKGLVLLVLAVIGLVSRPLTGAQKRAQRTVASAGGAASRSMARRSARAELETGLVEDPLRTQNRALSALVVVSLAALVIVVVWATSQGEPAPPAIPAAANLNAGTTDQTPQPDAPVSLNLPTPIPTATDLPEVLQARGTIAFVAREYGRDDIWAVPVGSTQPIRITNSDADDRDPMWSPDGRQLAYASRNDGNWEIYIYDILAGETSRMTYNLGFEAGPDWSPQGGEYLVYENYQNDTHLDIFFMRADGAEPPQRLPGSSDTPDFSPAWSPDGRRIAFVSWRDGNQEIYIFSLDTQEITNLTNTPNRHEDYPAWSPDGRFIAYTAIEAGIETIFIKPTDDPNAEARIFRRGRAPAWSPDGDALVFAVDGSDSTLITVAPFQGTGVATEVIQAPLGATDPTWTSASLPASLINSGGLPPASTDPLYVERSREPDDDPPYGFGSLVNITGPQQPVLSERVNDSFNALRNRTNEAVGWDFLGDITDALWLLDHRPQPGEERRNWHLTGRAFAFNRNQIFGFPAPIEIVREDGELGTNWRVYVRVADEAQNGELGEPLRRMPWTFADPADGDVEAYDQGGRLREQMPRGYYVDFTQLAADYGWERMPAGSDWRANFNARNFWMFRKTDGLTWYEAMRELYTDSQLGGWAPTPTPDPTLAAETSPDGDGE